MQQTAGMKQEGGCDGGLLPNWALDSPNEMAQGHKEALGVGFPELWLAGGRWCPGTLPKLSTLP